MSRVLSSTSVMLEITASGTCQLHTLVHSALVLSMYMRADTGRT